MFGPLEHSNFIRTYLKNKISVQGKARNGEKAEHTRRCEHFELFRNTAMGA
jgi:ribosomal protein L40E